MSARAVDGRIFSFTPASKSVGAVVVRTLAFVAGSLVFAALGRSAQLSVGADSTIAPIVAAAVAVVAVAGTPHYTHLVAFLALMVGVLMVAVGLLRLGWIADLLSTPVVTGVLAGIAVQILVRQIPVVPPPGLSLIHI